MVEITWPALDLILYPEDPSLEKRRSIAITSPYDSGLYGSFPPLAILTMIVAELRVSLEFKNIIFYLSPSLMRFLRDEPRFVAFAFAPRQIVKAVKMADFPDPL